MTRPIPEVSTAQMHAADASDPRAGAILGYTPDAWIRMYRTAGPVFRFAETGLTVLCGPEANAAAWKVPDDWSYAHSRLGAVFTSQLGTDYITASDGDVHRRQRKLLRPTIARDALVEHVPRMLGELDAAFAQLAAQDATFDLHDVLIVVFTRAFNRTLVMSGADDALVHDIARFEEQMILGGALRGAELAAWYARPAYVALRARVLGHFRQLVQRRLAGEVAGDSLDGVIAALPAAARAAPDIDELTRHAYLLQAGGAGNIASMACNLLAELLPQPAWLAAAVADAGTDARALAERGVQDTPMLAALLLEAERRLAPTPVMPKVARRDIDFLGVAIPQGLEVLHAFGVANFLPEHYPEPMRFDPQRWRDARPRKPVAFGGGEHMCLGIDVARVSLLLCMVSLLRAWHVEADGVPHYARVDAGDAGSPLRLAYRVRLRPRTWAVSPGVAPPARRPRTR